MAEPFISVSAPVTPDALTSPPGNAFQINVDHVELLCHLWTEMWKDLDPAPLGIDTSIRAFHSYASMAPYLAHQALALSALHLSKVRPGRSDFYCHYADGLQHEALRLFNQQRSELTNETCVPMLLFSWVLGLHMLCDTITYRAGDLGSFLDDFTRYVNLHRGVKLMTSGKWDILRASEFRDILRQFPIPSSSLRGTECNNLITVIDQAEGTSAIKAIYRSALESLQSLFDANRENPVENRPTVFAWPIVVPADFTDLLAQRRPEALVILAHYAVLLHRHRNLWVVSDGGEFLIASITKILGMEWRTHLVWPNSELQDTSERT